MAAQDDYCRSSIDYSRKRGFSLIEVIVVIALFAITSIVVTTSYIGFEGRERLKNAALQLKGDIRFVQSKAQSGDKGLGQCATTSSLVGWYVTLSLSGTTYTYAGDCLDMNGTLDAAFSSSSPKLPNDVTIYSLTYNGTNAVPGGILTILFKPLDYSVVFYDSSVSAPNFIDDTTKLLRTGLTGASTDEVTITLHNTDGDYQVKVNRSGEVHEVKI